MNGWVILPVNQLKYIGNMVELNSLSFFWFFYYYFFLFLKISVIPFWAFASVTVFGLVMMMTFLYDYDDVGDIAYIVVCNI